MKLSHYRRKGPGRVHNGRNNPAGTKLWNKCTFKRPR
jgi:hypothetical protein